MSFFMYAKLSWLGLAIFVSSLVIVSNSLVAQQTRPDPDAVTAKLKGEWVSGRDSVLEIEAVNAETGELTAWFRSSTGTDGKSYAVVGVVNFAEEFPGAESYGHPISFTVSWGPFGSISSWSGLVKTDDSRATIDTQWLHVRGSTQFDWDHTLTGSDVFTKKSK